MRELLLFLASSLCLDKESVRISQEALDDDETEYGLTVGQDDVSAVIGKHGRTVRTIRTLLAISSAKRGARATLRVDASPGP